MKSEISALVDGELEPEAVGRCLQRLKQDDDLVQSWREYHLIGAALRGEVRTSIDAGFSRRLAEEATILAPRAIVAARVSQLTAALSAAAGIAAVAVAAWVGLPLSGGDGSTSAGVASPAANGYAAIKTVEGEKVPVAVGVEDYLLAHQRFSPASHMQGVAPYVRTVSAERKVGQ